MSQKLCVLDLFSGIGGFSLGLEWTGGFETVAFCEIEDFPRKVLAKHWPEVPCHKDVRELKGDEFGRIDLICGGYPCQPFSTAGKRQGADDHRHLWPEVHRLMATVRPRWGLFENVAGHVSMGLDQVLSDLEGEGYTAWPLIIPACAVDAPHRRDRVWIIANSKSTRAGQNIRGVWGLPERRGKGPQRMGQENVAYAEGVYAQGQQDGQGKKQPWRSCRWVPEPGVGRVAARVPRRVDRLKGLGNAVVPQIPEMIGRAILESEGWKNE